MFRINQYNSNLIVIVIISVLAVVCKEKKEKEPIEQLQELIAISELIGVKPVCTTTEPLYMKGVIKDKDSGNRLDNVTVESEPISVSKVTDSLGKYSIESNLDCVYYVMTFSITGYKTKKVNQTPLNDSETEQEVQLTPCTTDEECAEVEDESTIAAGTPIGSENNDDSDDYDYYSGFDLTVESISTPSSITRGSYFSINVSIKNIGDLSTSNPKICVFLSNDSNITSDDAELEEYTYGFNLDPGQSSGTFTISDIYLSTSYPTGSLYLGVAISKHWCEPSSYDADPSNNYSEAKAVTIN